MKLRLSFIFIAVLIITLVAPGATLACWINLSSQELIQQADVLLIGDIVGPIGEEKIKLQGLSESRWVTKWKVKVYYYLKGSQKSNEFIVATPGAENKSIMTSADYRLDQWGHTVLLFLRSGEGLYEPLSPQGVVNLQKNESSQKTEGPLNGQFILDQFEIVDRKISPTEKSELEKFILQNNLFASPNNVTEAHSFNLKGFTELELPSKGGKPLIIYCLIA
ncbi:hypothetical protein SAMN05660649_04211 [Desulfotomaculum arcticum]|uniref:Lipoprotein n=1 Tax=Desulfotruncus arcticus DSM 17038 TaxID=1121424 RepID=A0A1I2XZR8_9FIRM|nr:hypothetical protein [Desulfotruncus arcticus]SFH18872.1 hypothetical protein SAMN05660649_04211 [Desulfotomaculum arcticum] [Desulfotruncus arcticus DSM 17038]